ncbi:MAG: glycosyltransferase [Patescibacteria group bacterium]|nr:glycosyltransferase [Patescibacteria group bacterium]
MISFIIPTKNEEKIIEKTLKCLSGYSGPHEIILGDGNSTDNTISIAKKYTNLIASHQGTNRPTIASGRNDGASLAHGEYLLFLDADMFIYDIDSFFEKALACFTKDPDMVAMTVRLQLFPEMATRADNAVFGFMNFLHRVYNNYLHTGASPGEFQMIRTEAFKKVGGFNPTLVAGEDYDMFRRLRKIGRTYFNNHLTAFHTGRRAHVVGWPKLLTQWFMNNISATFFKKAASDEWKEIR